MGKHCTSAKNGSKHLTGFSNIYIGTIFLFNSLLSLVAELGGYLSLFLGFSCLNLHACFKRLQTALGSSSKMFRKNAVVEVDSCKEWPIVMFLDVLPANLRKTEMLALNNFTLGELFVKLYLRFFNDGLCWFWLIKFIDNWEPWRAIQEVQFIKVN